PDALEVYSVAKQWMWKFQHLSGPREINELHVPVGLPVKVLMTSQDVIHSLFVPAFRVKQDVLPGRYMQRWFPAPTPGLHPPHRPAVPSERGLRPQVDAAPGRQDRRRVREHHAAL